MGVPVRVIDRVAEPGTTSRAVGVHARTLELYHQMGLDQDLIQNGVKAESVNLWARGRHVARFPLMNGRGLTPYPYLLIYPQDLHEKLLIARLAEAGVKVERPTELLRFQLFADHVMATLRHPDGREEAVRTPYLLGCDGARSIVRSQLGTGFPGGTYERLFYVADVDATGPALNEELHVDLNTSNFLAIFPLRRRGHARLIGTVLREDTAGSMTFADVDPETIRQMGVQVQKVHWFSTYHVHHRVTTHFRQGRAFLLGDAAHIHSPVGGQGMNTGIGDAINLAWKLEAVLKGRAQDQLLDSYEQERRPFAERLVDTTDRAFTVITRTSRIAGFLRTRLTPIFLPLLFRFPSLRRFFFRVVSQISIRYRNCPLNSGHASPLRGGDRLPWLSFGHEGDNFAPLTSRDWQLHVYGKPPTDATAFCREWQVAMQSFPWNTSAWRAGFRKDIFYLVRPDGYLLDLGPSLVVLEENLRRKGFHAPLGWSSNSVARSAART